MTTVSAEEARKKLSDIMNRAAYKHEPTVLTRHGKGIAAVVSMEDYELLQELVKQAEDEADLRSLRRGLKEFKEGKGIPLEKVREELGL